MQDPTPATQPAYAFAATPQDQHSNKLLELLHAQTESMKQMVSTFTQSISRLLPTIAAAKKSEKMPPAELPRPIESVSIEPSDSGHDGDDVLEVSVADVRNQYLTFKNRACASMAAFLVCFIFSALFFGSLMTFNVIALSRTDLDADTYKIVAQECTIVGFAADDCTDNNKGRVRHDNYSCRKNVPVVEYSDLCNLRTIENPDSLSLHPQKTQSILTGDFRVVNYRQLVSIGYIEGRPQIDQSVLENENYERLPARLCRVEYHVTALPNSAPFCGIVGVELIENQQSIGLIHRKNNQLLPSWAWGLWIVSVIFCCAVIPLATVMYGQMHRNYALQSHYADILHNNGITFEPYPRSKFAKGKAESDSDDSDVDC